MWYDLLDRDLVDQHPLEQRSQGAGHRSKDTPIYGTSSTISFILSASKFSISCGDTNICDDLDGISICVMVIIFGGFGSFSEFARYEAPLPLTDLLQSAEL